MIAPKVSVCMVTYNQERYIAQAINSALDQQTAFPYEIIVGEDCSTDGTRQIVRKLAAANPDKVQLRLAEKNQGGKANFTGVFGQARGEYVVILEGDDYFTSPHKLQRQAEVLDARPDWAICFHPSHCCYEGNLQGPAVLPEGWNRAEATIVDLFEQNFIPTSGAMFRNRLIPSLPPWFMDAEAGDWALHILNAAHGNIGFLPEIMSAYRIHPGGTWSGRSALRRVVSVFEMLTAVDHHFNGQYAREIDRNRITTVRWLFGQWSNATESAKKNADLIRTLAAEESSRGQIIFENGGPFVQERHALAEAASFGQEYQSLVQKLEALVTECEWFREAHREWTQSIAYRVQREIQRPWKQLWSKLQRLRRDPVDAADDQSPPSAKAA